MEISLVLLRWDRIPSRRHRAPSVRGETSWACPWRWIQLHLRGYAMIVRIPIDLFEINLERKP